MKGMGGYQLPIEGQSVEWYTPPHILEALGPFDDDPCTPGKTDGLTRAWRGRVWLNPPYGKETPIWLSRLADHGNGTALIFARTDTTFFFTEVWKRATACLFLRGRIRFHKPGGEIGKHNGGAPSVLVAYGPMNAQALIDSQLPGYFTFIGKPTGFVITH